MKRLVSITAAVLLIISALAGCQSAASPTTQPTVAPTTAAAATETTASAGADATASADNASPWAAVDLSKPETVNFYVVGVQGDDWQTIVDKANELMKKKINTTVNFVHVSWADFQSKYALYLAGDQDVDCIYGAAWCNYMDSVKAGAFKPLSEEFIQKYLPLTWKNEAPTAWKDATFNGKIYCVPNNRCFVTAAGVVTTQDLLDSVGMKAGDITDWAGLKTYLLKIAAQKNANGLYAVNPQGSWPADTVWYTGQYHMFDIDAGSSTWMVWDYSAGKAFSVDDLKWFADTDAYQKFALEMAEFNKAGVFPANVLQNQAFINDNYLNGKSAFNTMIPSQANAAVDQLKAKGKTLVYLDCMFTNESKTRKGGYMGYGACFPVSSKKTERAAVALDCMKNDAEVNMMLLGGVEGTHYVLDAATNTYTLGPSADKYPWDGWFYLLESDSNPTLKMKDEYQAYQKRYETAQVSPDTFPLNGFHYDSSKYSAELAVISSLINEYRFSFCYGVFQDNTKAKYDEFMKKCRDAGLDKIVDDYRAQVKAYIGG